jgi:phenylacetate-CoA ligase
MSITKGFQKAHALFQKTAHDIVAYRRFLAAHGVAPSTIRSYADWQKVPVMTKRDYWYAYPFEEFFPKGMIPPMVYASSGSSGNPTFWFRGDEQERSGAAIHRQIFEESFAITKHTSTLVIICFSMGVWVAGNYTLACCRELAKQGYRISTATPGIEMEDIIDTLRKLTPHFENIILAGYPPFLMDIVNAALKKNITLPANMKFISAGDAFTEAWRSSLMKLIGARDPLRFAISIYGSADAGVLGYETPLSVFLRREALVNRSFTRELFGEDPHQPALVQYDPNTIFFEEHDGELLFTTNTASPLIRYNIHDIGAVVSFSEMKRMMRDHGLLAKAKAAGLDRSQMPFVIKRGRNDVAVTFYALNIYPEHIKKGLDDPRIKKYVSGQFFAFNRSRANEKQQELCLNVELAAGMKPGMVAEQAIQKSVTEHLIAQNIEYRKLYGVLKERALPNIKTIPFGKDQVYQPGASGLIGMKGKKIKMIHGK